MATRGITIEKPAFMTDNEWHYFKLEYKTSRRTVASQIELAIAFHDGWECCIQDDTRRSIGEELPDL